MRPDRRRWIRRAVGVASSVAAAPWLAGCAHRVDTGGGWRVADVAAAPYLLLGEIHDNDAHHRLRAALLVELLRDGRPTTVLFEQMGRDHDAAIAATRSAAQGASRESQTREALADAVADAGQLDRRGWAWPMHRPIVEAALAGGATIRGANLEAGQARAVVRQGLAAAPADVRAALEADRRWSDAQQQAMVRLIDEGHCGMLPGTLHAPMVLAQRARDAAMALAMRRAVDGHAGSRAVLIAGNGHVRRDLGVPHVLESLGVAAAQVQAVGYLEPALEAAAFDLVATAPAPADRPDPCAAMRPAR